MFFTWMIAATMWMENDPLADPFRMAEEEMGKILYLPSRERTTSALPSDKKLVA